MIKKEETAKKIFIANEIKWTVRDKYYMNVIQNVIQ